MNRIFEIDIPLTSRFPRAGVVLLWLLLAACGATTASAGQPNWSVDPSGFQYSCTVTGAVALNDTIQANGNIVGAFVGGQVRGVAEPIKVGSSWVYFMTIYANTPSTDTVTFKVYLGGADVVLDATEKTPFMSNEVIGLPSNPYLWHVWLNNDRPPVLEGVPGESVEKGWPFSQFYLVDYLTELDGNQIIWTAQSTRGALDVHIDAFSFVTITPVNPAFIGSDTIIFTATDNTSNHFSSSDTVVYSVHAVDEWPVVGNIPDQSIGLGGTLPLLPLDQYLTVSDGDSVGWSYRILPVVVGDPAPTWSVNPSDFQFSMTLTARVRLRGLPVTGTGHILAALAGTEVRGVTHAVLYGGEYLFFLTIFSNTPGETIHLRLYDGVTQATLPTAEDISFAPNGVIGFPEAPASLSAGVFKLTIDSAHRVHAQVVDSTWTGSEVVQFIATDIGTKNGYSDSAQVVYSVAGDHSPRMAAIPAQRIEKGQTFPTINLAAYLTERDGDRVLFSVMGMNELSAVIDANGVATIAPVSPEWTGSETLVFKAADSTANAFFSLDTVLFTVDPLDRPPQVRQIPNQVTGLLGHFDPLTLDSYVTDPDGDTVQWNLEYKTQPAGAPAPSWAVDAASYQLSMALTAEVTSQGRTTSSPNYTLAAIIDGAVHGLGHPVLNNGRWIIYLTIFGNTGDEQRSIRFRLYDPVIGDTLPVRGSVQFGSNTSVGTLYNPYPLQAGRLLFSIDGSHRLQTEIVDSSWSGTETVQFTARELNRLNNYADSTSVLFTILNDHSPVLDAIPDQMAEQGQAFSQLTLGSYLHEYDGQSVRWIAGSSAHFTISIDGASHATITAKSATFLGADTVVFTAQDISPNGLLDRDTVVISQVKLDHKPVLAALPVEEIVPSGSFGALNLASYLTNVDGDSIGWKYRFLPTEQPDSRPSWQVVPGNYQYSMTMTARVISLGAHSTGGGNLLAAFHGAELRGMTAPVKVNGTWLYFLTMYANADGEALRFSFYDSAAHRLLPVKDQAIFTSNGVLGNPRAPMDLHASTLLLSIDNHGVLSAERIDTNWVGTENVRITAGDQLTAHQYADSTTAIFRIVENSFSLLESSHDFGEVRVKTTVLETVQVANVGTKNLVISGFAASDSEFTVSPPSLTIVPGTTGRCIVAFTPAASGPHTGTLQFVHNAFGSPSNMTLQGSGRFLRINASSNITGAIAPEGVVLVAYGDGQTFSVTLPTGYTLDSLLVDSVNIGAPLTFTFTKVADDHSIYAYLSAELLNRKFRTASYEDWALAYDATGHYRRVTRASGNVRLRFGVDIPPNTESATLLLGRITKGAVYADSLRTILIDTIAGSVTKFLQFDQTVTKLWVDSRGTTVPARVQVIWRFHAGTVPPTRIDQVGGYIEFHTDLPKPNLLNVLYQLFPGGSPTPIFTRKNPLLLGVPEGRLGDGAVTLQVSTDAARTLRQTFATGPLIHTGAPVCVGKFVPPTTRINMTRHALPPNKFNNLLVGELAALKINIASSATGRFPEGVGQLTFNDPLDTVGLFNGLMVTEIAAKGDSILSCLPVSVNNHGITPAEMYAVMQKIDAAFADTANYKDTLTSLDGVRLAGVRRIADVSYMHLTPGVAPVSIHPDPYTGTVEDEDELPDAYGLSINYPNPFNPTTTIEYALPEESSVRIRIFNILGQRALDTEEFTQDAGVQQFVWNAADMPSGVYFYRLDAISIADPTQKFNQVRKMLLVR